jgi:hypothetical protein
MNLNHMPLSLRTRYSEINKDLDVVLSHTEVLEKWRVYQKLENEVSDLDQSVGMEKNQVAAINNADNLYLKSGYNHYDRDYYGNMSANYDAISPLFLNLLKNQANVHLAKRSKFLKSQQYKLAALETDLFGYIYQNVRLYGHPITKTTKETIRFIIKNHEPTDLSIS